MRLTVYIYILLLASLATAKRLPKEDYISKITKNVIVDFSQTLNNSELCDEDKIQLESYLETAAGNLSRNEAEDLAVLTSGIAKHIAKIISAFEELNKTTEFQVFLTNIVYTKTFVTDLNEVLRESHLISDKIWEALPTKFIRLSTYQQQSLDRVLVMSQFWTLKNNWVAALNGKNVVQRSRLVQAFWYVVKVNLPEVQPSASPTAAVTGISEASPTAAVTGISEASPTAAVTGTSEARPLKGDAGIIHICAWLLIVTIFSKHML